ncbi:hypothetical protein EZV62_018506 [Acer yangbiense]|uniref:EF-hand domain-containing protein n=1 Tax=Acer yangbiense TaxID=1000413 RepID=A0A5C7HJH2_9ROSI|nr:hypothetical protein EZV62_018506 [Acer yangbiense]
MLLVWFMNPQKPSQAKQSNFSFGSPSMASSTLSSDTNQTGICVSSDTDQNFQQKHAGFFDRNKDGLIYPSETFEGSFLYF